jgi:hypothetical protein
MIELPIFYYFYFETVYPLYFSFYYLPCAGTNQPPIRF